MNQSLGLNRKRTDICTISRRLLGKETDTPQLVENRDILPPALKRELRAGEQHMFRGGGSRAGEWRAAGVGGGFIIQIQF